MLKLSRAGSGPCQAAVHIWAVDTLPSLVSTVPRLANGAVWALVWAQARRAEVVVIGAGAGGGASGDCVHVSVIFPHHTVHSLEASRPSPSRHSRQFDLQPECQTK